MGVISKKLASRFRQARRQLGELRRQAADFAPVPTDVNGVAALHEFLKFGKAAHSRKFGKAAHSRKPDESWNEFIFRAYHHHQAEAIFLTGLPDVKGSLPHA